MSDAAAFGYTIRQAKAADSDGILNCLSLAFDPFKKSYTPGAYADTVLNDTSLKRRLREMRVFVAAADIQIVGTIACKSLDDQEGHLRGMAVLPRWQGKGIAQQLLDRAESELRKTACKRITLDTTIPLERAVRFYERNGFHPTGRVTDFFGMALVEYEKVL